MIEGSQLSAPARSQVFVTVGFAVGLSFRR